MGLEPQACILGECPYPRPRELGPGCCDDVHADGDIDVRAERVEIARGGERRLHVGTGRSRVEVLGAFLRRGAERR
jgi:hypothetical protein